MGLGLPEAVLLFEEAGRALLPGPLVATHLAAGRVPGAAEGGTVVAAAMGGLLEWGEAADVVQGDTDGVEPLLNDFWTRAKFPHDLCARLELCRGVLNSTAATEHYPFRPHRGGFRHCEGWTAFNAAWNVTLAYACNDATSIGVTPDRRLRLSAPAGADPSKRERVRVTVTAVDGKTFELELLEASASDTRFEAPLPSDLPAGARISYGHGFLRREAAVAGATK